MLDAESGFFFWEAASRMGATTARSTNPPQQQNQKASVRNETRPHASERQCHKGLSGRSQKPSAQERQNQKVQRICWRRLLAQERQNQKVESGHSKWSSLIKYIMTGYHTKSSQVKVVLCCIMRVSSHQDKEQKHKNAESESGIRPFKVVERD